tara:strand:- start:5842 stop:7287 length:1446 start_codon:yes stop_codon:yes gene_type:complete
MKHRQSITKDVFLTAMECPTKGWFLLHGDGGDDPTEGDLLRMAEGQEVHRRAQSLHPEGVFAGNEAKTNELILDSSIKLIFEAAFKLDGYAARADWIRRVEGGWVIGEVKSSLHNEDETAGRHVEDIAYTTMVLRRAGLPVKGCEIVLMNREWRLGMIDEELFVVTDITDEATEKADSFNQNWEQFRILFSRKEKPAPHLKWACRNCDYFADDCLGKGVRDPIFHLPRLNEKRFDELIDIGALSIHQIPTEYKLSETQEVVATAIRSGTLQADAEYIKEALDEVVWPAGYLDFETVKTAIPLYADIAPHEQIVTQYSMHIRDHDKADLEHRDYLADHSRDCCRELAERLLVDTQDCETIFVYSSFEKTVLRKLSIRFPDLAQDLESLGSKLFDLLPIVRNGYVHPDFKGKSSIKVVLPVVAPDLSYEGLTINNGDAAVAAFAHLAMGKINPSRVETVRSDLLGYCELDTLAMVRLHEGLRG